MALCLTTDAEGDGTHWEVLDSLGNKLSVLPQMSGPMKAGFGVVVLNGKLIVMARYSMSWFVPQTTGLLSWSIVRCLIKGENKKWGQNSHT
ncbi:hypothetical protein HanIR_Chr16g0821551 [Helianthus annuus]|nr:hypothetical protein HanIR_Chr16g0821551 [Helianthus annuus]